MVQIGISTKIYDNAELRVVEGKMGSLLARYAPVNSPHGLFDLNDTGMAVVEADLSKRKKLLDDAFVMDEEHMRLLRDFNEALKTALMDLRRIAIRAYDAALGINPGAEVRVMAKCFLGCTYPELHPIQTRRARDMWAILNGSCGCLDPRYKDGVLGFGYDYHGQEERRDDYILYPGREITNWNEGLDPILTRDMRLVYAFHHLYRRCKFSILDLLWIRDFTSEITVSIDSHKMDDTRSLERFLEGDAKAESTGKA